MSEKWVGWLSTLDWEKEGWERGQRSLYCKQDGRFSV